MNRDPRLPAPNGADEDGEDSTLIKVEIEIEKLPVRPPYLVKLTYFKLSGRYYSEGDYYSQKVQLHRIWAEIQVMASSYVRPGLIDGEQHFITLVEVPDHPNACPHLIFPEGF